MHRELGQRVPSPRRSRRFVALLSLAIAVLATAATSPAIPETLALTSSKGDVVLLESEHPRAAFELTVRANAAALPPGGDLYQAGGQIEIAPSAPAGAPHDAEHPLYQVILVAADPEERFTPTQVGGTVTAGLALRDTCAPEVACKRAYQVLIGLVGPAAGPVDVRWQASVRLEYLVGREPAGAVVEVDARPLDVGPPRAMGFGALEPERLVLGSDNPVVVREVTLRRPAPGADGGALADAGRLSLSVTIEQPPGRNQFEYLPVGAIVTVRGQALPLVSAAPWDLAPVKPVDPFAGCPPDRSCEVPLLIAFRWTAGRPDETAALTWSLAAWGALAGTARDPFTLTLDRALAVPSGAPALVRSVSGSAVIRAEHLETYVNYWLHVPPEVVTADVFSGGQIPGLARVHAMARTDGPLPVEVEVRVAVFPGDGGAWIAPAGGRADVAADVMGGGNGALGYGCDRSAGCRMPIGLSFWIPDHQRGLLDGRTVTVDWTMEVTLPYFNGGAPPAGAGITLERVERFPW